MLPAVQASAQTASANTRLTLATPSLSVLARSAGHRVWDPTLCAIACDGKAQMTPVSALPPRKATPLASQAISTAIVRDPTIVEPGKASGGYAKLADSTHVYSPDDISIDVGSIEIDTPGVPAIDANSNIDGSTGNITINAGTITTTGDFSAALRASAYMGNVDVKVGSVLTTGEGGDGIYASSYLGNTSIDVGSVNVQGKGAVGVIGISGGSTTVHTGDIASDGAGLLAIGSEVNVTTGNVTTSGDMSQGIYAHSNFIVDNGQTLGHDINVTAGSVATSGYGSDGIVAINTNSRGNVAITADSVTTQGDNAWGVVGISVLAGVNVNVGSVTTSGDGAHGIYAQSIYGSGRFENPAEPGYGVVHATDRVGNEYVVVTGDSVTTHGAGAYGVFVRTGGAANSRNVHSYVDVRNVETTGDGSIGVVLLSEGQQDFATLNIGKVSTAGDQAHGIVALAAGRASQIDIQADSVTTTGNQALGIVAQQYGVGADIKIAAGTVSTSGQESAGILAATYAGNIKINAGSVTTRGDTSAGIQAEATFGLADIQADTVSTSGKDSAGIQAGGRNVVITAGNVTTAGNSSSAIVARGTETIKVTAATISTSGGTSAGIVAEGRDLDISVGTITTTGDDAIGIASYSVGRTHGTTINLTGGITTSGTQAVGIYALSGGDLTIHNNGTVSTSGSRSYGILAQGLNNVTIDGTGSVTTTGDEAIGILALSNGAVSITQNAVSTAGDYSAGVRAHAGAYGFDIPGDVTVDIGTVTTKGTLSDGIVATNSDGNVSVRAGTVSTSGAGASGIVAIATGNATIVAGDVSTSGETFIPDPDVDPYGNPRRPFAIYALGDSVNITATGSVSTVGDQAIGIYGAGLGGTVAITAKNVSTTGARATAVRGYTLGGDLNITTTGAVRTTGEYSYGVLAFGHGALTVDNRGSIETTGDFSSGIYALARNTTNDITITDSGSISSSGNVANAIRAISNGGNVSINSTGTIAASGDISTGILAVIERGGRGTRSEGEAVAALEGPQPSVNVSAKSVSVSGALANGVLAINYRGDVNIDVGNAASRGAMSRAVVAQAAGNATIKVGSIDAEERGVLSIANGDNSVTVTGQVRSANHVAVEMGSGVGKATLNVATGASVIGGGKRNPADGDYVGPGNAVVFSAQYGGAMINNDGLISNTGDQWTVYVADAFAYGQVVTQAGATINNRGRLEGAIKLTAVDDVVNNGGTMLATKDSDFGAGSDRFVNTGALMVRPGQSLAANAPSVTVAGTVRFKGLEEFRNEGGLIDLRNGVAGDRLVLDGGYVGSKGARLGLDLSPTASDMLIVNGAATGKTTLLLRGLTMDNGTLAQAQTLVRVGSGSASDAFQLENDAIGLIQYGLAFNAAAGTFDLTAQAGAPVYRLGQVGRSILNGTMEANNTWSAHMAERRDAGVSDGGLWAQGYGNSVKREGMHSVQTGNGSADFDLTSRQAHYGYEMGYDAENDSGFSYGVSGGYGNSTVHFTAGSQRFDFDTINAALYAGLHRGMGFFNLRAQYGHSWAQAKDRAQGWSSKFQANNWGLAGEAGARFDNGAVFVEPLVSLSWQQTNVDDMHVLGQTIDIGTQDSLIGKVGGRIGGTTELGATKTTFYLRGSYIHAFSGNADLLFESGGASQRVLDQKLRDFGQAAVGVNFASGGPISGFIEGNADFGGAKGGGGRAGVRVRF